ncbi:unnamed protein product [Miscanthus lutarioriparius]|uniref:Uncharacterized protein n=1 Tax=Miscanthus lutarioriparius TaxID=422564 RepID=A0A811SA41_9POAL|nr:unnamed protein product [Miscanthus lutarioriparius]
MKPTPLDYNCGPAAAAAAGCAGWAWRPRPRPRGGGRAPGVSPKCSHSASSSSSAAAGVVPSEHRRREVLYRPVEQPGTGYGSELEARIEKVIFACRFMTFLGIGGLLLGSVPCFLKGSVHVMNAFVDYYLHGGGKLILMLLEAIEMFLIGTVTFVLGIGLYELFISTIDSSYGSNLFGLFSLPDRPKWVEIKSLNDLKTKLGHVIVLVLLVGIFEKSKRVTITSCADLLCFAGTIFLSSVCLYLLSKLHTTK